LINGYSGGLRAGRPGFGFRARGKFSLLHSVQTGSGAHPVSYSMGTGGIFLGGRAGRRESDHSLPSRAEVTNGGAIPPLPHMSTLLFFTFYALLHVATFTVSK
jgi:hypothetical protein